MHKRFLAIGVAAVALTPTIASAQSQPRDGSQSQSSCEHHRSNRVVATVAGAGVGGVLGNVIAGKGDKTIGTIIGAVGGAVVGNQIAKPSNDCNHAYGYYDEQNRWHATGVSAADGRGYYDRVGNWVDGPPTGRYGDDNRWIASPAATWGNDRYSEERGWVPASANGYYDRNDQWVTGSASGYHDANGRWIPNADNQPDQRSASYGYYDKQGLWHANAVQQGRATGYYDRDNNWVSGTPNGHYDERHNWVPHRDDGSSSGSYDSQNRWIPASSKGYYDNSGQWIGGTASGYYDTRGRWVAGATTGHYDTQGRWISGPVQGRRDANGMWVVEPQPGYYDTKGRWNPGEVNGYYDSRGRWIRTGTQAEAPDRSDDRRSILPQVTAMSEYIDSTAGQRSLSRTSRANALRELRSIRQREKSMRHDRNGDLSIRNEAALQLRLDRLSTRLRIGAR
jgi:hypothetical protein